MFFNSAQVLALKDFDAAESTTGTAYIPRGNTKGIIKAENKSLNTLENVPLQAIRRRF